MLSTGPGDGHAPTTEHFAYADEGGDYRPEYRCVKGHQQSRRRIGGTWCAPTKMHSIAPTMTSMVVMIAAPTHSRMPFICLDELNMPGLLRSSRRMLTANTRQDCSTHGVSPPVQSQHNYRCSPHAMDSEALLTVLYWIMCGNQLAW